METALKVSDESFERRCRLRTEGFDLENLANHVAELLSIEPDQIFQPGKLPFKARARSLFAFWAAREIGFTMADLAPRLKISQPAVRISTQQGEHIAAEKDDILVAE